MSIPAAQVDAPIAPMGILLAIPWDQRTGGVTHVVATLARSLISRGHQVTVLFPADAGLRIRTGLSQRGLPALYCRLRQFPPEHASLRARLSWYSTVYSTLPQLARYCQRQRIGLVNVHYPGESTALLVDVVRHLDLPLVVSAHGTDVLAEDGPRRGAGLLRQLQSADTVVVPSQNYLSSLAQACPAVTSKLQCIHNGYDEEEISTAAAAPAAAAKPELTLLSIASLIPKKGIDVLLRALLRCRSKQLKLRLIGEGPLRSELESLAASLGVADRVAFLGPKSRAEVLTELRGCDLVVVPSRHASESFGLAGLEAMAFSKPVIASAIGGLSELVSDGQTGILVPPDDPAALARALDQVAEDKDLLRSLGAAGRRRASRFTVRATADAYERLFSDLVARAGSKG